jgi:hypothetical protein
MREREEGRGRADNTLGIDDPRRVGVECNRLNEEVKHEKGKAWR